MRKLAALSIIAVSFAAFNASASFWLKPTVSTSSKADIKHSSGDVKTSSYGIAGGNEYFTLGYKKTEYDFSGTTNYLDELNILYADLHYEDSATTSLNYFLGLGVSFGWEDDFHLSDNYNVQPRAGVKYKFNSDFAIIGGVGAQINEPDSMIYPIIMGQYRDKNDYGFSCLFGYPMIDATYRFSPAFALKGKVVGLKRDVYQLKDDSAVERKGYVIEDGHEAVVSALISPFRLFSVEAGVNATFNRDFEIYNHDGDKVRTVKTDPNVGVFLNGSLNF